MSYNTTKPVFDADAKIKDLQNRVNNVSLEEMKFFCKSWQTGMYLGLHKYSFFNYCIANMQLKDLNKTLTVIAPFNVWKDKGICVNKGEKAIHIFAPIIKTWKTEKENDKGEKVEENHKAIRGFRLVPVFDICQTNGTVDMLEKTEGGLLGTWVLGESVVDFKSIIEKLQINLKSYAVSERGENGYTDGNIIAVLEKTENEMIATLIHEIAHFNMHFSKTDNEKVDKETREVEAESVSYLVCSAIGLENTKAPLYIKGWGNFTDTVRIKKIMTVTEKIISMLLSTESTESDTVTA